MRNIGVLPLLAGMAAAFPPSLPSAHGGNSLGSIVSSVSQSLQSELVGPFAPISSQILRDYLEPIEVRSYPSGRHPYVLLTRTQTQILRNSYVVRDKTELKLGGKRWTASGANVYWLGLEYAYFRKAFKAVANLFLLPLARMSFRPQASLSTPPSTPRTQPTAASQR